MIFTAPNSNGDPLREFNQCHDVRGKFCSGPPRGLVGRPASGVYGRMFPSLAYDLSRAHAMGIGVTAYKWTGPTKGLAAVLMKPVEIEMRIADTASRNLGGKGSHKRASRGSDLSFTRHEIGHVVNRAYGLGQKENQLRIRGVKYPARYAMEFGAWKQAVRDAPFNRVNWHTVKHSLYSYLSGLTVGLSRKKAARVATQHADILKRYGRKLRKKALLPAKRIAPLVGGR